MLFITPLPLHLLCPPPTSSKHSNQCFKNILFCVVNITNEQKREEGGGGGAFGREEGLKNRGGVGVGYPFISPSHHPCEPDIVWECGEGRGGGGIDSI